MPRDFDLPRPPFLYTQDQVAQQIQVSLSTLVNQYVWHADLTTGRPDPNLIVARNINPPGMKPEWRIAEGELTRWLKRKGFRPRYNPWN